MKKKRLQTFHNFINKNDVLNNPSLLLNKFIIYKRDKKINGKNKICPTNIFFIYKTYYYKEELYVQYLIYSIRKKEIEYLRHSLCIKFYMETKWHKKYMNII